MSSVISLKDEQLSCMNDNRKCFVGQIASKQQKQATGESSDKQQQQQQQDKQILSSQILRRCSKCNLVKAIDETKLANKLKLLGLQESDKGKCLANLSIKNLTTTKTTIDKTANKNNADDESDAKLRQLARRIPCLGVILSLLASINLGTAGMLVKMTTSVHGVQVAAMRAIIQLVIYSTIIFMRKLPLLPARGERLAVAGRSLFGGASITFSYFALKLIPLGDATTIRFSLPIWTLIVSYLFLGESCSVVKVCAVFSSVTGVFLIAKPDYCSHLILSLFTTNSFTTQTNNNIEQQTDTPVGGNGNIHQLLGSSLALASSVCLALSFVSLRLCQVTRAETTIFWLSSLSALFGFALLAILNELRVPSNASDCIYIILNGLFGAIGQWCITSALKVEQSGIISLARTFDIVVAFCYGTVLLHEQITLISLLGAMLVCGGVLAVVLPKWLCSSERELKK